MDLGKYNLLLIAPSKIEECKQLITQKGWQWSFMGTDPCLREKLINKLGIDNKYSYGEELQEVCMDNKNHFLNLISETGKYQDSIFWWATNIAYKNPLSSDLYLNFCYLILIKRWKEVVRHRVIIIENPWLLNACLYNFNDKSVYILKDYKNHVKTLLFKKFISHLRGLLFLVRSIRIWVFNKIISFRDSLEIKENIKSNIDILTCSWIENRSFIENNKFYDPYLGTLNDYYEKKGYKVLTITLQMLSINLLKKAYASKKVVPLIYFIRLSDIFRAYFKCIFNKVKNPVKDYNNHLDFSYIFEGEMIHDEGKQSFTILQYIIITNLFKKQHILGNALIYPFENQPWDKIMVKGIKETGSKIKIIGYQHTVVPPLLLNYFLGNGEKDYHPQPDLLVSNGEYWGSVLKKAGFSCPIVNGGSLRFKQSVNKNKSSVKDKYDRNCNILVLLSISLWYSLDLIYYLLRVSSNSNMYLIKPHPDTPENKIRKYINILPDNFIFIDGSIEECIVNVGAAIHTGTTAAIECLMQHIPVVKYLPERVDIDPLLGMKIKQKVVTDKDVMPFSSMGFISLPEKNILSEPFNQKVWKNILE